MSLAKLLTKAEYRLHGEMNLGPMLTKIQECHNFVRSLATSLDTPSNLRNEYKTHYSNTIEIGMGMNKSLSFEDEAKNHPIPVS